LRYVAVIERVSGGGRHLSVGSDFAGRNLADGFAERSIALGAFRNARQFPRRFAGS
jgi:hypothetical protein